VKTIDELDTAARELLDAYPRWRTGQAYFNALARLDPALAETVRATALDPFHQNARLPEFKAYVAQVLATRNEERS
jgi:hypothetical protein